MNELTPTVGQWYMREDGRKFEVIDIDDGDGYVELQDEDGMLDEIETDAWPTIDLKITTQPLDSTAAFDEMPTPDEADGGDPVELDGAADPQRVANAERLNASIDLDL
ncbi:MAG TPA: DUF6763 family protein [Steroidobacteraceae bacterium]|nr:DUF6763 family protein [Steroidobacteraceae bacterium]